MMISLSAISVSIEGVFCLGGVGGGVRTFMFAGGDRVVDLGTVWKAIIDPINGDNCGGELYQRADEKPEIVKERLKTFHEVTEPVTGYYKEKGLLAEIDANLDINNPDFHVIEDCQEILNKL